MNVLAVIPARGGSKGIPRKNVRLMNGKPLIYYAISNAKACENITDIVVTTDDSEIISVAKDYDVDIIERELSLAEDNVTLDPVIYDAVIKMEQLKSIKYDVVVTLQATSPLLKSETLNKAIKEFVESSDDTCISAVNKPHLAWTKKDDKFTPLYEKRLNRQQLPPRYSETGAFLFAKRECVLENSRIGNRVSVFEVSENESVDIDSYQDWILCESELKRKRIILRADGYKDIGMGHIYHCLTLAYNLAGHDILIVTNEKFKEGLEKIKSSYLPFETIRVEEEFFNVIEKFKPDIVVNDLLNTSTEYVNRLKNKVSRVVTIEDIGEGRKLADAAINALYEEKESSPNQYYGEKYICLRDEFLIKTPKEFSSEIKEILVLFGGTDPGNFTKKIYEIAKEENKKYPNIVFNFVTGMGYNCKSNGIETIESKNIFVINNTNNVSKYMRSADLAITSQGRTVYELASLGVPSVVMAQNDRETLHTFAQMKNGFLNLGLGENVYSETIIQTLEWLIMAPQVREEMRRNMLSYDLKSGIERIKRIILGEEIYE